MRVARHALLIGVPDYDSGAFATIPTVRNDLRRLHDVLKASGYDRVKMVPALGDDVHSSRLVTRAEIQDELRQACAGAPEGGVLFIYFSGHGLSRNGVDYFVPGEVRSLQQAAADETVLVKLDLSPYLDACRARAVVLAIDACRDNLEPSKGVSLVAPPEFGRGTVNEQHRTRVATLYGCDRGEFCYFNTQLEMSFFADALCTVLAPEHKARTVVEIRDAAEAALQRQMAAYRPDREQHVYLDTTIGYGALDTEAICEGLADPWRLAVHQSRLWSLRADHDAALRSSIEDIASDAWNVWQMAGASWPDDPWSDPDYPVRCLARLDDLVESPAELSSVEVAALLAAPFLAEAVHADGMHGLLRHDPRNLSTGVSTDSGRQELEAVHASNFRVRDKAILLAGGTADEGTVPPDPDVAALRAWLAHRCVLRQVRLWQDPSSNTVAARLSARFAEAVEWREDFRAEPAAMIRGIASLVAASADELDGVIDGRAEGERAVAAATIQVTLPGSAGQRPRLRGRTLAVLLGVAGQLALDVRRWGEVIVDHIGVNDPLNTADLPGVLKAATWEITDKRRTLRLEARCPHPAVHLALQEVADGVHQQLTAAHRWSGPTGDEPPIAALPLFVDARDLRAKPEAGRPSYETPLLQFRLAHNEVRELLMGVRLYGDPALAVRELYQNALDACRYRAMRARFRGQTYSGQIRIEQGVEHGRHYIECVDNGIGMGRRELEQTFSRAGRRFVTSSTFLWEQAQWLERDEQLRLWPNSQFGIGVFSYFMLADEILVESNPVDRNAQPGDEVLQVQIPSGGSLFRIKTARPHNPHPGTIASDGGARVRLYLKPEEASKVSSLDTLTKLLWYSEFDVVCVEQDRGDRHWQPGRLNPPADTVTWHIPVTSDGPAADTNVWWVSGKGALLADGIATDQTPSGFVVNLTREHRPNLSVDRNRLEQWNHAWVQAQLRLATRSADEVIDRIDFDWLQRLAVAAPEAAQFFVELLERGDRALPIHIASGNSRTVPIGDVGVWPLDLAVLAAAHRWTDAIGVIPASSRWDMDRAAIDMSRIAVWRAAGYPVAQLTRWALTSDLDLVPRSSRGHPHLQPLDFTLAMAPASFPSSDDLQTFVTISRSSGETLASLLLRLRRLVIHGLRPPSARRHGWDRPADDLDVTLTEALVGATPIHAAIRTSAARRVPVRAVLDRMTTFADLDAMVSPAMVDPQYVCTMPDTGALGRLPHREPGCDARYWITDLMRSTSVDALVRALGPPFERLDEIATAAVQRLPLEAMLSRHGDPSKRWLRGDLGLDDVVLASATIGEPPLRTVEMLRKYADLLDFRVPEGAEALPARPPTHDETVALRAVAGVPEHLLRDETPDAGATILALATSACGIGPAVLAGRVAPWVGYGWPDLSRDASRLPDRPATRQEATTLAIASAFEWTVRPPGIDQATFEAIASTWGITSVRLAEGALPPMRTVPYPKDQWATLEPRDQVVLSRDLDRDEPFLGGMLDPLHIARAADDNDETIQQTLDRVSRLADRFPVAAATFPWGRLADRPLSTEYSRLSPAYFGTRPLTAFDSERTETVAALYRAFAIVWPLIDAPDLDETTLADLEFVPDACDDALLEDEAFLGAPDYTSPDDAHEPVRDCILRAIQRAGRFAWPVREVVERIHRFAPLLRYLPPMPPPEIAEHVPDWQDLVLLTPGCDGRDLLTTADLRDGHVALAARETGLSEAEVVDRLRRYAGYCGFEV
ncbi:caspase family protein [Dactylosporangium sp. NPDC005555]|uniref:HD domain-containing protein n=1 Tax=Dactylosporangium sp. NPDC005555 TaxID=3154889 RepID=UPI0033B85913